MVLGIVLDDPLAQVQPPAAHGVHTASIRWEELATYTNHPKGDEFARYLEWKRSFLPAACRAPDEAPRLGRGLRRSYGTTRARRARTPDPLWGI